MMELKVDAVLVSTRVACSVKQLLLDCINRTPRQHYRVSHAAGHPSCIFLASGATCF